MKATRGFTLIELMIVVAIVAILASVALPSYRQYIIRGNRAAAQSEMMDIANREQQYILANRVYATAAELGYTLPADIAKHYGSAITPDNTVGAPPSFIITFTPTGSQASDGVITLNSAGVKTPASKW